MKTKKKILIVDDNKGVTSNLTLILRKKGFETEVARTGREALTAVRKRLFDVVLLDNHLPDIDSVALLPTFIDILPETTIILMSADSSEESLASASNKSYLPFLTKPLDMDIVLAKVREAIDDGGGFSERRHSMKVIEEIQERFRTMIETSNDLFFQCNVDGIITYCSPASKKLLDYSPEEVIGTHFKDYFSVSEFPTAMDAFQKTLSGEKPELLELLILKKDQTLLPIEVNSVPIVRGGKIIGSQGIIRNITERKRAEEALRYRERILDAITFAAEKYLRTTSWREHIDEVLARLGEAADVSRVYIFENRTSDNGQLLTRQRHEWVAAGIEPQIDNPDLQEFPLKKGGFKRWVEIMGEGKIVQGNVEDFPKNEKKILSAQDIVSIVVVPIFAGGSWWGFIGFDDCTRARDWSKIVVDALRIASTTIGAAIQRERTEKLMNEQTFIIEEIFHNVQDGIGIVDANERIIFCNPAYASILDAKVEQVIGRNLSEFMDKSAYSTVLDQTKERRKGKSSLYDLPLTTGKGIQKHIRVSASPRFTEDGRYVGAFGSIRDITDMKRVEEALQRSEKRYRELVDNALVGIFQSSIHGETLFVNDALVEMMEYESAEEMIADGATSYYKRKNDRKLFIDRLKKEKKVNFITTEVISKKGKKKFFEVSAVLDGEIISGSVVDATERILAREALEEAKDQLRHIVDSSPSVIYSCSIESRGKSKKKSYVPNFVSANIKKMFGYEVEECLGDHTWWARHIHPKDKERAIEEMKSLFTEGHLVHEYRIRRKDGDYTWIQDSLVLLRDSKGKGREFVGSWSDVTDRKDVEFALQESEAQWRSLTENSPDHIVLVDKDGVIQFVNHAVPGLEVKNFIGTTLYSHFSEEIQPEVRKIVKSVMETCETTAYNSEYELPDGRTVCFETLYSARKVDGRVIGLTLNARDVTERKRDEKRIQESEAQWRSLTENSPDHILLVDKEGVIQFLNHAAPGLNVKDIIGTSVCSHYPEDKRPEVRKVLESVMQTGETATYYTEYEMPDGQILYYESLISARKVDDEVTGLTINTRDITERKETEMAILRRDAILEAVSYEAREFIRTTSWEDSIQAVLERLGKSSDVCRTYLFQNHEGEKGEVLASQLYEWVREGVTPQIGNPDLQNFDFRAAGWDRWIETLGKGKAIYGHKKDFPEVEQRELNAEGVKSICVMPIFVGGAWWGSIGFSTCLAEREWTPSELDALRAAANILGSAIRRSQSEEELKASEEKYRDLVDNALVGIIQSTIDGKILFVNNALIRMAGFKSCEEMIAQGALPRYRDLEQRKEWISRLKKDGRIDNFEMDMVTLDGSPAYGLVSASLNDGIITSVTIDITDRKRIEEELKRAEQKYRAVFESTGTATVVYDEEMTITMVNEKFEQMFGYKREELEGRKTWTALVHEEDLQRLTAYHRQRGEDPTSVPASYECKAVSKRGEVLDIYTTVSVIPGTTRRMASIIDISDRKEMEEELLKSREELRNLSSRQHRVREEERSRISREIHDELGQSLSALKMNLSWLANKIPETEKVLIDKVKELEKLVEGNVLLVQKIATELRPRLLDDLGLTAAIEWYLEYFQKQSEIKCRFSSEPGDLILDNEPSITTYRIFQEALTNIYRHAEATRVNVRLKADIDKVVLTIRDNGVGISSEKVNDPLSLGIIGMKERAIDLGGKITIRGTKSKGTTLTLTIPLHKKGKSS